MSGRAEQARLAAQLIAAQATIAALTAERDRLDGVADRYHATNKKLQSEIDILRAKKRASDWLARAAAARSEETL